MTEQKLILFALVSVEQALTNIHSVLSDLIDSEDGRLVEVSYDRQEIRKAILALQGEWVLSPPSPDDKQPASARCAANSGTPEPHGDFLPTVTEIHRWSWQQDEGNGNWWVCTGDHDRSGGCNFRLATPEEELMGGKITSTQYEYIKAQDRKEQA